MKTLTFYDADDGLQTVTLDDMHIQVETYKSEWGENTHRVTVRDKHAQLDFQTTVRCERGVLIEALFHTHAIETDHAPHAASVEIDLSAFYHDPNARSRGGKICRDVNELVKLHKPRRLEASYR